jgi:acyl-CoA thioester hydrolase
MADFVMQIPLRWNDFDSLAHVNNVRYLEFMQDGRVALFTGMGLSRDYLQAIGHFVARSEIDYLIPISMNESEIKLVIWVQKVGGASYNLGYEIINSANEICARAMTVMVTVELTSNTVTRIPDDIRNKLEELVRPV